MRTASRRPVVSVILLVLTQSIAIAQTPASPMILKPIPLEPNLHHVEWCDTHRYWASNQQVPNVAGATCSTLACDEPSARDAQIPDGGTPIKTIRLHFVVLRDGRNVAASERSVHAQVDKMNADYALHRIQFVYTWEYVDDSTYRTLDSNEEVEGMKQAYAQSPATQCNIFVANFMISTLPGLLGRATFPWQSNALTETGGIIVEDDAFGVGQETLTHEMGHCLGLLHTFRGVSEFDAEYDPCFVDEDPCDCACYERADGTDADTTGDFCSDTPPTPKNNDVNCNPPGGDDLCSATAWGPTQPANYMGYNQDACWTLFTSQQAGRMHCWLQSRLASWVIRPSGSVVAWGLNNYGQSDVPDPNSNFVEVAAGRYHTLGLKGDGSIVGWGRNDFGQIDVPLPNTGFVAVAAGENHSLGLKRDGTVFAWGWNNQGQSYLPPVNSEFVRIAAGAQHSLALKADGSVIAWGWNIFGQTNVPSSNGFVEIAAGLHHSLALRIDGSIVGWGVNGSGELNIPDPNKDFVGLAARWRHSLGLKVDGSIVGWGYNDEGQTIAPKPNSDFVMLSTGLWHSLGLKSEGYIFAWGCNLEGQTTVPVPNAGFIAVGTGYYHSLGIRNIATFLFGDINHSGSVNLDDILCILSAFGGNYVCAGGLANADIMPCGGNGVINLDDILAVLQAFGGTNLCP